MSRTEWNIDDDQRSKVALYQISSLRTLILVRPSRKNLDTSTLTVSIEEGRIPRLVVKGKVQLFEPAETGSQMSDKNTKNP
jgi:hypothetical protein